MYQSQFHRNNSSHNITERCAIGSGPICTKTPSNSTRRSSSVLRSLYEEPSTIVSNNFNRLRTYKISTLERLFAFSCKTLSAFNSSINSKTVTFEQIPARSIAASILNFHPLLQHVFLYRTGRHNGDRKQPLADIVSFSRNIQFTPTRPVAMMKAGAENFRRQR